MATAEVVIEDIQELVDDTTELVRESWTQNPKVTAAIAGTLGVLSGGLACYLVVNSRLKKKYEKIADEQVADVKEHYSILRKENVNLEEMASRYPDAEKVRERIVADEIITTEGYRSYDKVPPAEDVVEEEITVTQAIVEATTLTHHNFFESDDPDTYFDFEEEMARRESKPDSPFVITKDEFEQGEADYDQATLTYYDGDDVLADSKDTPVDDLDMVIGFENVLRFGHGSGDPNIVYIRNNKLELDFEVVHSDGKFAKEVLGFDDELRHSDRRPLRKFRASDE